MLRWINNIKILEIKWFFFIFIFSWIKLYKYGNREILNINWKRKLKEKEVKKQEREKII